MYSKNPITAYRVPKNTGWGVKSVCFGNIYKEMGFILSKQSEALILLDFCLAQKNGYPSEEPDERLRRPEADLEHGFETWAGWAEARWPNMKHQRTEEIRTWHIV